MTWSPELQHDWAVFLADILFDRYMAEHPDAFGDPGPVATGLPEVQNYRARKMLKPGMRFGRLVIERFDDYLVERSGKRRIRYMCRCDCGALKAVTRHSLISGNTMSCGCLKKEISKAGPLKHGHAKERSPVYRSWCAMLARCYSKGASGFKDYGGRGIYVCKRWQDFKNFLSDMGEPPPGMTLDRKEVNGNYEPENCRWATSKVQMNNRRNNVRIVFEGQSMTATQLAEQRGLKPALVTARLYRGLSPEEAILPVKQPGDK